MSNQYIFSVSELNKQINNLIESRFSNILVKGEISQLTKHPSGHMYFNIKDDSATLSCAIFYYQKILNDYMPQIGDKVLIEGKSSIWIKGGAFKFHVSKISPVGEGDLWAKFEALKKDLLKKGLFDLSHKKKLPEYPKKIALITSLSGSVIKDILDVISRNSSYLKVVVRDCRMQGDGAAEDLMRAIDDVNSSKINIDVIIIARGGGSLEDLWCFNNEKLAYKIFESKIPIISAIGHETDTTISDLVADKRAGTPSIAAEIVAPSTNQCLQTIDSIHDEILSIITKKIENYFIHLNNTKKRHGLHKAKYILLNHRDKLSTIKNMLSESHFRRYFNQKHEKLNLLNKSISNNINIRFKNKFDKINYLSNYSQSFNPKNVMKRGYSFIYDSKGKILKNAKNVKSKDKLNVKLYAGELAVEVLKSIKKENL